MFSDSVFIEKNDVYTENSVSTAGDNGCVQVVLLWLIFFFLLFTAVFQKSGSELTLLME